MPARALPSSLKATPGAHRDVFERAVALVAVELVGLRVVGDQQIRPAIAIVIEHGDAQRFGRGVEDAALGGDVFERAIAAIAKQPAGGAVISLRRAVGLVLAVHAAEDVVLRRPLHVVADEQIEQAVAIVIEPQRRSAEARCGRPGRPCSVTSMKRPLPVFWNSRFCPTAVIRISGKPSLL